MNSLEGFNKELDEGKDKINELVNRLVECVEIETHRGKKRGKYRKRIRGMWERTKGINLTEVPEERTGKK